MKTIRNLSGIYFRHQLKDGTWGNVCFEDLPPVKQHDIFSKSSDEWRENMIIMLCRTINRIGDEFDITAQ